MINSQYSSLTPRALLCVQMRSGSKRKVKEAKLDSRNSVDAAGAEKELKLRELIDDIVPGFNFPRLDGGTQHLRVFHCSYAILRISQSDIHKKSKVVEMLVQLRNLGFDFCEVSESGSCILKKAILYAPEWVSECIVQNSELLGFSLDVIFGLSRSRTLLSSAILLDRYTVAAIVAQRCSSKTLTTGAWNTRRPLDHLWEQLHGSHVGGPQVVAKTIIDRLEPHNCDAETRHQIDQLSRMSVWQCAGLTVDAAISCNHRIRSRQLFVKHMILDTDLEVAADLVNVIVAFL